MELHTATMALFLLLCLLYVDADSSHKKSTYIVHMDKTSMPKPFSSHHFWYSSILKSTNPSPKLLYIYDHAFHGFSVSISQTELQSLKHSPGFVSAYPDSAVTPDTTHTPDFLSLNSASGLWPTSHYGKDVIIGVIDSGIWPESPSFSDLGITTQVPSKWKGVCDGGVGFNSSLCNNKIIGARYFNQGWKVSGTFEVPDTARDDDGHGSHVSSIAAGNFVEGASFFGYAPGTARGMAPRARLAVYKALWGGSSVSSDVLAAMDQAVEDGVDILSISLGVLEINLYESPLSIASFEAREKGIVVCISDGNRGPGSRTI